MKETMHLSIPTKYKPKQFYGDVKNIRIIVWVFKFFKIDGFCLSPAT